MIETLATALPAPSLAQDYLGIRKRHTNSLAPRSQAQKETLPDRAFRRIPCIYRRETLPTGVVCWFFSF
jgi:hypothetical protein